MSKAIWKINLTPMKTLLVLSSLFLLSDLGPCPAQVATNTAPPPAAPPVPAPRHILFQAPDDDSGGVLPSRIGGGSRGGGADAPTVEVLVPEHVALTTEARPLLFWYQTKGSKATVEISVMKPMNPEPIMLCQTSSPTSAGVHYFRVAADLKPSVLYRWSVAVVLDPQNRSQDVVAYGVIKRIAPSPGLAAKLAQAPDQDKPTLYAQSGIWYDALESLSMQIKRSPNDNDLQQERTDLLKQVGLENAQFAAPPANSP